MSGLMRVKVVPAPAHPKGDPREHGFDLVLHGDLARFIRAPGQANLVVTVVAGGGIEPPTCGL